MPLTHHEGHEGSEDEALQAFLKQSNVEVDQKSLFDPGQFHVC
jgi:hypothetical protein